jgi:serine/threonine-protein kinase
VKVVDFGLVKQLGGFPSTPDRPAGTPLYMAPEAVVSPPEVGVAADLYAVGAVGYFLLTGTPVFQGRSAQELSLQHLRATPEKPGERLGRPVPADLEAIILRCLEKDPALRPGDARQLEEMLATCADAAAWGAAAARQWWDAENAHKDDAGTKPAARAA